jgi:hypothetical protein
MINPRRQSMSGARRGGVFREGSTYDLEMHNGNATTMMGLEGGDVPVIPIEQQIMQIISKNETDLKEKEEEEKQRKDGSLVRLEEEITRLRNEKVHTPHIYGTRHTTHTHTRHDTRDTRTMADRLWFMVGASAGGSTNTGPNAVERIGGRPAKDKGPSRRSQRTPSSFNLLLYFISISIC